jgi:hypothetical protein
MGQFLAKLVKTRVGIFALGAIVCVVLAAVAAITFKDTASLAFRSTWLTAPLALVFTILMVIEAGITWWREWRPTWSAKGITGDILSPLHAETCSKNIKMNGTISHSPGLGSHPWIVRRFSDDGPFFPVVEVVLPAPSSKRSVAWNANVNVGGEANHKRWLELWLVGPDAHAYLMERKRIADDFWAKLKSVPEAEVAQGQRWNLGLSFGVKWMPEDVHKLALVTVICSGK